MAVPRPMLHFHIYQMGKKRPRDTCTLYTHSHSTSSTLNVFQMLFCAKNWKEGNGSNSTGYFLLFFCARDRWRWTEQNGYFKNVSVALMTTPEAVAVGNKKKKTHRSDIQIVRVCLLYTWRYIRKEAEQRTEIKCCRFARLARYLLVFCPFTRNCMLIIFMHINFVVLCVVVRSGWH